MASINPFDSESLGDLGAGIYCGQGIKDVDSMFKETAYSTAPTCIVCGQPAAYRIVAKKRWLSTAQIEDKGFVCEHCLQAKLISTKDYGIRDL